MAKIDQYKLFEIIFRGKTDKAQIDAVRYQLELVECVKKIHGLSKKDKAVKQFQDNLKTKFLTQNTPLTENQDELLTILDRFVVANFDALLSEEGEVNVEE